jgi:O-antigen ligase
MSIILSLKELAIVSVIAAAVFSLTKPIALSFMDSSDWSRRRNCWFVLTATGFLAPSFWVFALVAIPLTIAAGRKDSNPCAVYLMLFQVIPPIEIPVPMIGIQYLVSINIFLLLSFCVLAPVAWQMYRCRREHKAYTLQFADLCLLAFGLLTALLYIRTPGPDGSLYPASTTESLRRAFVFFVDTFVPYYAVSRAGADRRKLTDMFATYCLCCALLAAVAMFESVRQWLLYGEMPAHLGGTGPATSYLMRAGGLRAMASTGHPMALAHLLVLAYGLWLYLQSRLDSKAWKVGGVVLFWFGLFAAFSRGALISAVVVYFLFGALQPRSVSTLFKATASALIVGLLIYLSPLGEKIVTEIPWLGGREDFDVTYRERLWDRSWQLVKQSPFLGDQEAMLKMQDLRQGEGIVDLVNTYAEILLNNGFLGLALFLAFILTVLFKAWAANRRVILIDQDLCLMGAALVASTTAMLLLFWNGSFGTGPARMFYVFAGFATGYSTLVRSSCGGVSPRPVQAESVTASR